MQQMLLMEITNMFKIRKNTILSCGALTALMLAGITNHAAATEKIIHDAEYYILEAQNGKIWAVEDGELDKTNFAKF